MTNHFVYPLVLVPLMPTTALGRESKNSIFWQKEVDGYFRDIKIPSPKNASDERFNALPEGVKEGFNRTRWYWRYDTPQRYQESLKGYYRMIGGVDNELGKIRGLLKSKGIEDNTIIIWMGDNGYFWVKDKWQASG